MLWSPDELLDAAPKKREMCEHQRAHRKAGNMYPDGRIRIKLLHGVYYFGQHLHVHSVEQLGAIQPDPAHPIPAPLNEKRTVGCIQRHP